MSKEINHKQEKAVKALEHLSEAISAEVDTKKTAELGTGSRKRPVAVLLENPQILKDLANVPTYLKDPRVRKAAEKGIEETQKQIVVFYEQATKAGERLRGLLFFLIGSSILLTGLFAQQRHIFDLKTLVEYLAKAPLGRGLAAGVGVILMAYGWNRLTMGIDLEQLMGEKPKKRYVQKKLA